MSDNKNDCLRTARLTAWWRCAVIDNSFDLRVVQLRPSCREALPPRRAFDWRERLSEVKRRHVALVADIVASHTVTRRACRHRFYFLRIETFR